MCVPAPLAPAAAMLIMTPETGSNCGYVFVSKRWFWGEHTDSITTARSYDGHLCFMGLLMQLKYMQRNLLLLSLSVFIRAFLPFSNTAEQYTDYFIRLQVPRVQAYSPVHRLHVVNEGTI